MPAAMYRNFLPRFRFTPDLNSAWPMLNRWAKLGLKMKSSKELKAKFSRLDSSPLDGKLLANELQMRPKDAMNTIAFHDLNADGAVTLEESRKILRMWSTIERH